MPPPGLTSSEAAMQPMKVGQIDLSVSVPDCVQSELSPADGDGDDESSESLWLPLSQKEFKLKNTLLEYGTQSLDGECDDRKAAHLPLHLPAKTQQKEISLNVCLNASDFHTQASKCGYEKVDFKVKNTFIDDFRFDEQGQDLAVKSCPASSFCSSSEEVSPASSRSGEPEQEPQPTDDPLPSPGSAAHGTGACRPCAWFWRPEGCQNGTSCRHCHLCPEGELITRKKAKVMALRLKRTIPESVCDAPKSA